MSWMRVCNTSDVPENAARKFWVDGAIPVLVVNYGKGFRVIPPVCPHMEEPLDVSGIVSNCILTCTKHLWAWNLVTLDMQGETAKALEVYDVKIDEDGQLLAFVDRERFYEFERDDDLDDDAFFSKS